MIDESILTDELNIECQLCFEKSTLKEWNDLTYESCTTREMRRKFTGLKSIKAYRTKKGSCYRCPKCGGWLNGYSLILYSENGDRITGIAGHPALSLNSKK